MGSRSRTKAQPYIPSYMDISDGPEPCVVCGDAATGFHYRCMTCEGCKGFFRRTTQKDIKYFCKGNNDCVVDKSTRNQCQQCRYRKCVQVGMATDLVLNDNQRVAKRQLIEENREKRRLEQIRAQLRADQSTENVTDNDRSFIDAITTAYCRTLDAKKSPIDPDLISHNLPEGWERIMAPYVRRIVSFAQGIPCFRQLNQKDKTLLLNSCWLELLLLNIALQFDYFRTGLILASNRCVTLDDLKAESSTRLLLGPLLQFADTLSRLQVDNTETSMIGALLILHPDRPGLQDRAAVESAQDKILSTLKRYLHYHTVGETIRWPKLVIKVTDVRALSQRHSCHFTNRENTLLLAEILGNPDTSPDSSPIH